MAVFAVQNNVPVTVTFLVWRFDSSLALVLLLALALGAVIVTLAAMPRALRLRWLLSRARKEVEALKAAHGERENKTVVTTGQSAPTDSRHR